METKFYTVTKIEGEYAYLREQEKDASAEMFIAMALLPPDINVGTKLHWEMFEYTVVS